MSTDNPAHSGTGRSSRLSITQIAAQHSKQSAFCISKAISKHLSLYALDKEDRSQSYLFSGGVINDGGIATCKSMSTI